MELKFAATSQIYEKNEITPDENLSGNIYHWGTRNQYPQYILTLYNSVPTLHSIIDGVVKSILGKKQTTNSLISKKTLKQIVSDYVIFGGYIIQVIYQRDGNVNHVECVDISKCRVDKKGKIWYYPRANGYEKYIIDDSYLIGNTGRNIYPSPIWSTAVKSCEIEKSIQDYHLNAINNSFTGSFIVNINGDLTDVQKNEIEKNFNEKFCGKQNTGRVAFSFNGVSGTETTLQSLPISEFGEQYQALADYTRQQIFTAFRVNPNIFGIATEGTGFSGEEYVQSYKLYNLNIISPCREDILEGIYTFIPRDSIQIEEYTGDLD